MSLSLDGKLGVWLGIEEDSNEARIGTEEGVIKVHSGSVKRKPGGTKQMEVGRH